MKEAYLQALERNGKPAELHGYLTTALSQDAATFVEETAADKPFFLYLAYNAPHAPLQAPKEAIARYSEIKDQKRRVYAAMVHVMDHGIGLVLEALERKGVRENTLVFFLSDNGGPQAKPQKLGNWNGSSNAPFRGGKGNLYDGGVHVPFVAYWPAKLPQGVTYDSPVMALDIGRTAVECAGGDALASPAMEGTNLIPHVLGSEVAPPHEFIYWRDLEGTKYSILTHERTKYIKENAGGAPALYALPRDTAEANDQAAAKPELAKQLQTEWETWNAGNVPNRLANTKWYHKQRDQFFLDSVPKKAAEAGYRPKRIPTMGK